MTDKQALSEGSISSIAAACHLANAAYCRSLGDDSQPSWDDAPDWLKNSAINGVVFHLTNPDAGDQASHENWLAVKEQEGWKYGEVKDEAKKLHPCMVPYADLPREQQFKDALFRMTVHQLAPLHEAGERLAAELAQAKRALSAQKSQTTKARNELAEVQAVVREQASEPRAIAALKGEPLTAADLLELVQSAENVEVVASDGEHEIMGIMPIRVRGERAWVAKAHGLALNVMHCRVQGPGPGQPPYRIAGYGLVLDGELVAYRPRPEQLTVGPGQSFNLASDVIF